MFAVASALIGSGAAAYAYGSTAKAHVDQLNTQHSTAAHRGAASFDPSKRVSVGNNARQHYAHRTGMNDLLAVEDPISRMSGYNALKRLAKGNVPMGSNRPPPKIIGVVSGTHLPRVDLDYEQSVDVVRFDDAIADADDSLDLGPSTGGLFSRVNIQKQTRVASAGSGHSLYWGPRTVPQ